MKNALSRTAAPVVLVAALTGLGLTATAGTPASAAAEASHTSVVAYEVDNVHSTVLFKVGYFGVSNFWGRFNELSGSYLIDMDNLADSTLEISVKAESIDTNNGGRDKHLRNPDFFDARSHPEIAFTSSSFSKVDDDTVRVTGSLTFRGRSREVSADLDYFGSGPDAWGNERSGFQGTFTINRSEFGSTYGIDNNSLADQVDLTVAVSGTRK
ncbi:MAG: YceI family protein [Planctomycetota bacterium]